MRTFSSPSSSRQGGEVGVDIGKMGSTVPTAMEASSMAMGDTMEALPMDSKVVSSPLLSILQYLHKP